MRQRYLTRHIRHGRPVTLITSEDHDDWEARFFDEVQAEVDAGYPLEDLPWPVNKARSGRRTVATTRSSSPFYQLPAEVQFYRRPPYTPRLTRADVQAAVQVLVPARPRYQVCRSCFEIHAGECA